MKMPLDYESKLLIAQEKIQDWYYHFNGLVYVSFSGGRDSTVLLDLVRKIYPDAPAVFIDTGLEFPEIRDFVKTFSDITWIKPTTPFKQVIKTHGFPVISKENAQKISEIRSTKSEKLLYKRLHGGENGAGKLPAKWQFLIDAPFKISHKCCDILKKNPVKKYEKETGRAPYIGTMIEESRLRLQSHARHGCNAFGLSRPQSRPLMPWTREDILFYLYENNLPVSEIYKKGYDRTGCMFCGFGAHTTKDKRFDLMAKTHPKQYRYCMENLGLGGVLEYIKQGGKK